MFSFSFLKGRLDYLRESFTDTKYFLWDVLSDSLKGFN